MQRNTFKISQTEEACHYKNDVSLFWMPGKFGNIGITGNKTADQQAKLAIKYQQTLQISKSL